MGRDDVRRVLQKLGDVAGEVRVPGVRVQDVGVARRGRHRQVGRHGEQGGIRADLEQRRAGEVREDTRLLAGLAEAMHLDVDQPAKLTREVLDMHPGPAVDLGWVLAGEERNSHDRQR